MRPHYQPFSHLVSSFSLSFSQLEGDGAFAWKCDNEDPVSSNNGTSVCPAQTAALLNVQLIAQTTQVLSPLLGQFMDRYGAPSTAMCMAGCIWTGLLFVTISSTASQDTVNRTALDRLLYVAFALLAMGTWMGGLLTVHTGLYFDGHTKSRVIFLLNALFDAGSLTYLFLWWLFTIIPASLTAVASGYLISALLIIGTALYFWKKAVPEGPREDETSFDYDVPNNPTESEVVKSDDASRDFSDLDDSTPMEAVATDPDISHTNVKDSNDDRGTEKTRFSQKDTFSSEAGMESEHEIDESITADPVGTSSSEDSNYVLIADRTPRQQLTSGPYLLLCLFFGLNCCANQWSLTTARDFLAYLGDDALGNRYLTIFTLLMPVSIIGVPFVDAVILRFGFAGGFQGINLLALGYNIVKVSSNNLNVQIVGFVLFSFFRSFLFGVTFSFMPTLLNHNVVGKAAGIMYAIAGVATIINIPLANLAVQEFSGNFFIPNLIFTFLVIPCVAAAWGLDRAIRKERRFKDRAEAKKQRLRQSYGGVLVDAIERNVGPIRPESLDSQ